MTQIKTFNLIKSAVWNCVLDQEVPKSEQMVNLILLKELMVEIQTLIDFNELRNKVE
jgi:hypothetical protein